MIKRLIATVAIVCLAFGVAAGGLFFAGALTSRAVQNPTVSLDMARIRRERIADRDATPSKLAWPMRYAAA